MDDKHQQAALWQQHIGELEELKPHEEHLFIWKGRAYVVYPADEKDVKRVTAGIVMD